MATIPAVKGLLTAALLVCAAALLTSGCGEAKKAAAAPAKPTCAYARGWQKLANRIKAPVYCPGWLPDPLQGQIGGEWNNINSVSTDRETTRSVPSALKAPCQPRFSHGLETRLPSASV